MKSLTIFAFMAVMLVVVSSDEYPCPMEHTRFVYSGDNVLMTQRYMSFHDCGELCIDTRGCNFFTQIPGTPGGFPSECTLFYYDAGYESSKSSTSGQRGCT